MPKRSDPLTLEEMNEAADTFFPAAQCSPFTYA